MKYRVCQIKDCEKSNIAARSLCHMHYRRWRLYGDPLMTIGKPNEKHGGVGTPEYRIWTHMKGRCLNETDARYADYGGRGIIVCDRWVESFAAFLADMGPRPSKSHSIDRIDNDGGYEPSNCRWATDQEQSLNKRVYRNSKSGLRGIRQTKNGTWEVRVAIGGSKQRHIGTFKSLEEAIENRGV